MAKNDAFGGIAETQPCRPLVLDQAVFGAALGRDHALQADRAVHAQIGGEDGVVVAIDLGWNNPGRIFDDDGEPLRLGFVFGKGGRA